MAGQEEGESFEFHEGWKTAGLENFDEWLTLADAGMLYLKHLLIRLQKQGKVLLTWEIVANDLRVISQHRAIVRAREADVIDLIAANPERYGASFPREPKVRPVSAPVVQESAPVASEGVPLG